MPLDSTVLPGIDRRFPTSTARVLALRILVMGAILGALFLVSLAAGSARIPLGEVFRWLFSQPLAKESWGTILDLFRLPKALTALIAGASLSLSGLLMQTLFRNPLAGPYVLGTSSGAALGVALAVLTVGILPPGFVPDWLQTVGQATAAIVGSTVVMLVVLGLAGRMTHPASLLILGLMFGYATGGVVNLLLYFAGSHEIQGFLHWSFGGFSRIDWTVLPWWALLFLLVAMISWGSSKSLNALLLGDRYALSLGINVRGMRFLIVVLASILAGATTAWCGPVAFLGIAVPHLARGWLKVSDHRWLIPAVVLCGGILALAADIVSTMPGTDLVLPLNSVTSMMGAPVVVWVVLRQHRGMNGES